jgi:hypothetical protein
MNGLIVLEINGIYIHAGQLYTSKRHDSCIRFRIPNIKISYYMASITSGEMADCDWLRSTFSGHKFQHLKQNSKTD